MADSFIFPTSYAQQRLWFLDQLEPGSSAYILARGWHVQGRIDLRALQQALDALVMRHEILRTTFKLIDGMPMQIVAAEQPAALDAIDLRALPAEQRNEVARQHMLATFRRPFDLARGPLFRTTLIQTQDDQQILVIALHHSIADGWSMGVLYRDLGRLYAGYHAGSPLELPELPIQYADFASWQREWLQGETLAAQLDYWRQQLAGAPLVLELPTDRPRPEIQSFNGAIREFRFSAALAESLRALSRDEHATLFMTLLAAFQVLLLRVSQQTDLIVGSPVANRQQVELEELIGCFVNTLPLRADLSGNPSFRTALARVRESCLQAYAHQDLPFEQLVEALQPARDASRSPVVQVMFDLQSTTISSDLELDGLTLEPIRIDVIAAAFDLMLTLRDTSAGLSGWVEYNSDLFDEPTIARLIEQLEALLAQIAAQPELPIEELSLLTPAARSQLLAWSYPAATVYPTDRGVHHLIAAQAARTPDVPAVIQDDQQLTYHELDLRAEQLAALLRHRGVRPGMLLGLCVSRSLDMAIGLLGILKAGAAYLPLDPDYPSERLAFMLADAEVTLVLTQSRHATHLAQAARMAGAATQPALLQLDTELPAEAALPIDPGSEPEDGFSIDQLAYVIYTSGSTGQPKGTLLSQRGLVNHACAIAQHYALGPGDRVWQFASISFDVAAEELFPSWIAGATVVLRPADVLPAPADLTRLIADQKLTVLNLPIGYWQAWSRILTDSRAALPSTLRLLIVGNEQVPAAALDLWRQAHTEHVRWINAYGPTEATITATLYEPAAGDLDLSRPGAPIGRPIANVRAYLLDRHMQLVPPGMAGEIYLGGPGLAWGYHRRPDLSAEKFIPDPLSGVPGARLYRTGDQARYLPDGNLEFLGRGDQQVKLRGFRIELGEIEAALRQHPAVHEAAVLLREDSPGDPRLVAYLVENKEPVALWAHTEQWEERRHGVPIGPGTRNGEAGTEGSGAPAESQANLRAFLKERLPGYMLPSAFVVLDEFPRTPSGKLDRRALPRPQTEQQTTPAELLPQTEIEHTIAAIWQAVLGRDQVARDDNFFDLGGHSLLMIQVHQQLSQALNREIALIDLFRYPSISALASYLGQPTSSTAVPASGTTEQIGHETVPQHGSDIAIVGLAGRFPGAADLETFWRNLRDGVESIAFFSDDELLAAGVDPALLREPTYVKAYGRLSDVDLFDAAFFNITPREAEILDPQQRVFLECAWEALESAGYNPASYPKRIGVYAGASLNRYVRRLWSNQELRAFMGDSLTTGNEKDYLPTRVSYKLNLRGPSVNIQTACSTSLVAIHTACRSLLHGECELALAGGVSIQMLRKSGYHYQEGGILAPDGHCRAFDASAQGTVIGDGVGVVVLKRLADALADGDTIHAVIKGSAINNDGAAKVGYTAPSIQGQAEVISAAQAIAGTPPQTISYVEAHGTGTVLGDPIEVAALAQAFGSLPGEHRCALGSLKSNIGHLDAAAGVAGVIKTVLALKHQQIPPSLHFERANPQIDFANDYFYVNTKLSDWPRSDTPRRAGVSSFGIGGTNAHLILEEAPPPAPSDPSRPWQLLLLSARSGAALDQATANIAAYFRQHPDAPLADVAYTLQVGRKAFAHRRMLLCQSVDEALTLLEKHDADRVFNAVLPNADTPPLLFLFPGQGAQYVRMAFELYQTERSFRQTVDRCAEILLPQIGRDLREILFADDDQIAAATRELNQTALTQPALFVVEYALARLLMSWGVQPTAMIGHSIGEYVAACLAGVFSLDDALMLVARRGQLIQQLPGGAMLAVLLPEQELLPLLGQDLDLAAVNSPSQCVVAGPEAAIARLEARLMAREIQARRLHTSHAFHSRMMDGAVADFAAVVRQIQLNPPRIPYLSNVTGTWISAADATDPEYWARHLRSTVRFAAGIGELLRQPRAVLLEVGPGRSLSTAIKRHPARGEQHLVHTTLRHSQDQQADSALLLTTLGQLWLAGVPIDWDAFYAAADVVERRRRVPLPTYPFERQRYWVEETQPAITDRPEPARRRELADWLYAPLWKQALPPLHDMPAESGGAWLIFADDCGLGSRVAEHLQQLGHDTILVRPGTEFGPAGDNAYTIDPESRRSYDALFQALRAQGRNVERIIHLWSVTTDESPRPEIESIQQLGCYSLIYLAQALADHGLAAAVQIGVVSNGVQRVTGAERLHAAKATLLGPCRVIPQEYPQLACRSIDIEVPLPGSWQAAALADQLIAELFATESEPLVAYRGGQRWVQICEPVPQLGQDRRAIPLREGGVYLITGGLGGIGLELAHYLAQTVRARLVLVGRSAFPQRDEWQQWPASHAASDPVAYKIRRLQAIEEAGGEVMICRADVADRAAMRDVIAAAEARFGQVHGLIHAAGVGGGGVIQLQTPEKLAPTFAPKVQGTLVLAELLNNNALDFVVLCSSLRTIVGGFGTVDYCAANAFLDAFAQHASCQGRTPTIAINWDSWSEVGMSAEALRQDADEFGEQIGITPAAGVELFRRILGGGLPQVIVATNELQAEIEQEQAAALMRLQAQPALDEPAAANTRPKLNSPYVAPRTAVEQQIATIWQDLLGITPIGIEDNFFELGGDSIVSLQVAAKAKRYGLHLTPKLIFDQQTIAQLATIVEATHTPQSEQGLVVGPLPLTPIQHSFFEEQIFAPQHWNQSVMLAVPPGHDAALLERALQQLLQHHDALRLRFRETEAGWQQINSDDTRLAWSYHDLSQVPEAQRAAAVETLAAELQPRFDLASGPLVRGAFFDYGPQRSGRLLIIIHHLLIDIVSWRIVLEDLNSAYQQLQRGETIRLPEKSSSFKQWAERLVAYASSPALRQESNDWLADARQATPRLPIDDPAGANTAGSARALRLTLDALTTQALVQELPALAHVQVNEVLLTALAQTIAEWSDQPSLWVELEGHGREALFDDVDLSRTVGWFTSLFPVRLSLQGAEEPGAALQAVKQRLRRIPAGGIGYGLLRYLSGDDQIIQSLQAASQPEIIFLYLGHITQRAASAQELTPVAEPRGPEQHPDGQRRSVLEVSTRIAGEQLEVEWRYSANLHRAATIEALAQRYMTALRSLIDHCRTRPIGVTPTDFPDADLSQADLDDLLAQLSGGFQQ